MGQCATSGFQSAPFRVVREPANDGVLQPIRAPTGGAGLHPVTRRDWWLGITLIVFALGIHALLPRYEYRATDQGFDFRDNDSWIQIDHWTGTARMIHVSPDGLNQRGERPEP